GRLLDDADLVIDLCTPEADAMVDVPGLDTPVGPGSTLAYVAIVNSLKVRIAQLLTERGVTPPVITRASVVGAERSQELFDSAYREHARRIARALFREPDDEPDGPAQ
ncbi:MAG: SIS domain-containing protein, partial [Chloroflexota bacterium]